MDPSQLKRNRLQAGLSQQDLALRSGVSQSYITKIESGALDPSYSKMVAIQSAFDVDEFSVHDIMNRKVVFCKSSDTLKSAVNKMRKLSVSQMPVIDQSVVGLLREADVLEGLVNGKSIVGECMSQPPPMLASTSRKLLSNLLKEHPLVLIVDQGKVKGVVSRSDLFEVL